MHYQQMFLDLYRESFHQIQRHSACSLFLLAMEKLGTRPLQRAWIRWRPWCHMCLCLLGCTIATNHSLRSTAAEIMFASGVPEKVLAQLTWYKSYKALQVHEQSTAEQVKTAGLLNSQQEWSVPTAKVPDKDLDKLKNFPILSRNLSSCTININL